MPWKFLSSVAFLVVASACAAAQAPASATGQVCPQTLAADDLSLAAADATAARATLVWPEGADPDALKIAEVKRADGRCASQVSAFIRDHLLLGDGRIVGPEPAGNVLTPKRGPETLQTVLRPDEPHPEAAGAFVMAFPAAYRRDEAGLSTQYLGIWRNQGLWDVRSYTRRPDGTFSPVRQVISSRRPLRSVTYIPSVDGPSGRLGLAQIDGGRDIQLISLLWFHPQGL